MMYLYVTVDTNDADYVSKLFEINEQELAQLKPLIEAIRDFKPYQTGRWRHDHNFPYGEYHPRTDLGEKFPSEIYADHVDAVELMQECFTPSCSFHSIEAIELLHIASRESLLRKC